MDIWNLTLPHFLGYAVMGWLLLYAIAHAFAARECKRQLATARYAFESQVGPWLRTIHELNSESMAIEVGTLRAALQELAGKYPATAVLMRILEEPAVAQDDLAVSGWINAAIHEHLGTLRTSMEQVRQTAPIAGITGTVAGLLIGTWLFGQGQSQTQLMTAVALALVTTLLGGLVVLVERLALGGLIDPLEVQLFLHCQITAAQARMWLSKRASVTALPWETTVHSAGESPLIRPLPDGYEHRLR